MKKKQEVIRATKAEIGEAFKTFFNTQTGEMQLNVWHMERNKILEAIKSAKTELEAFALAKELKGNDRIFDKMMAYIACKPIAEQESPTGGE
jgi:hypothetical protein